MEILLILVFALVLTSFVSEGQKAMNELAKATPRERSLAIAKIMILIQLIAVSIALAFKGVARFSNSVDTIVKIGNH